MTTDSKFILGLVLAGALIIGGFFAFNKPMTANADVTTADYSTTTNGTTWTTNVPKLIKTGPGTFSKVLITKSSNSEIYVYDATTTNVNLRTGNKATSTILLAQFGQGATSGTYNFNSQFGSGLTIEVISSVGIASSTITWQ